MRSPSGDRSVRIASRGSQLALWQAEWVRTRLEAGGYRAEIEVIRTVGDRIQDVPLAWIGDRGLFTKEIDAALLEGRADIAVHSLKDVPTRVPDGLRIAAISPREDPRDVMIAGPGMPGSLADLPESARVGTSSLRRRAQLGRLRPDLRVVDLRGNLNTRIAKLDAGDYDAVILAAAGVVRLGWASRITEWLDPAAWLPAVGQGALAIIVREDDTDTTELVIPLEDATARSAVVAERAFLRELEGGCQVPIGALARIDPDGLEIDGLVSGIDGTPLIRDTASGPVSAAADIGRGLALRLLDRGAADVLAEVRRAAGPRVPPP